MVDGFDEILNMFSDDWNAEFFGSLKNLTSRSGGGLVLVITLNRPLSHFQKDTQKFTQTESPYFNFLSEILLGGLPEETVDKLLKLGKFDEKDIEFIKNLAGSHPYLLQMIASTLYENNTRNLDKIYRQISNVLDEIWQSWPASLQQTFTSIALAQMVKLKDIFKKQRINVDNIINHMNDDPILYQLDLEFLKQYGFLVKDENILGGWRIVPLIFLPFILYNFKPEYRKRLPKIAWEHFIPN